MSEIKIEVKRKIVTKNSTIGEMYINGQFECYTLEDIERPVKIKSETAIPKGTYGVIINMSNRFKKEMPLLLKVPNFEGVRIHSGNTNHDTEGCILVGKTKGKDFIGNSRVAFSNLMKKLKKANKISITISCFLIFLLCSCGARKVDTSKVVEASKEGLKTTLIDTSKTKKVSTDNVKTTKFVKKDKKTQTSTKTVVDEPIDPSKPAVIENQDGTKSVLNNSKRTTTETTVLSDENDRSKVDIEQSKNDAKIDEKGISANNESTNENKSTINTRNLNRKGVSFSTILWLILIILLLLAWIFREKIPYIGKLFKKNPLS